MPSPAVLIFLLGLGLPASPHSGAQSGNALPAANVNSRYIVESVDVTESYRDRLSQGLRDRIQTLVGAKFSPDLVEDLARRIRRELSNRMVVTRLTRGAEPEFLRVAFIISEKKDDRDSVSPRLIYHSRQNFTFGADANWRREGHHLHIGALTDNDERVERYSGIRGGYQRSGLAAGHLSFGLEAASFRSQWNPAVQTALAESPGVPGIYRTRVHFQPSTTITFSRPLTLQLGVSLERLQMQFPTVRHELSSAAFATLRFGRRWELTPLRRHDLDASYSIRSASGALDSDFVFTRHQFEAGYAFRNHREQVRVNVQAGLLNGRAPLFERFTLGNSRTLRGWNRFDVDPLGGDRMVHGSLEYRYRPLRLVYDAGAAWRRRADPKLRHSVAIGIARSTLGFTALVAFPIRSGSIVPVFMTGINF
jgi:hypothetical protein